jgi:hypothetical protein
MPRSPRSCHAALKRGAAPCGAASTSLRDRSPPAGRSQSPSTLEWMEMSPHLTSTSRSRKSGCSRRPVRTRKRRRPSNGQAARLRVTRANEVWAVDFQFDETADRRRIKLCNIVDEYTREALAIRVDRTCTAENVITVVEQLTYRDPFSLRLAHSRITSFAACSPIARAPPALFGALGGYAQPAGASRGPRACGAQIPCPAQWPVLAEGLWAHVQPFGRVPPPV